MVSALGRARTFARYYDTNYWADPESRSGPGSRQDSPHVRHALEVLAAVTERYAIRTIADIPCGDFNWIDAHLRAWPEVEYSGFDIVPRLIERNRRVFPGRRFARFDIVLGVPPPCDLIFCKDLINHLEDHEIVQAIAHMRQSGSRYLLATNNFGYLNRPLTRDRYHHSRHVDLTTAPFHYPPPIWHDHYLGLWPLVDMAQGPASVPAAPRDIPG
ncbi:MAG: hypothetical protein PS018_06595 [bacterium]|nr:hypothetical protein [bacterium]